MSTHSKQDVLKAVFLIEKPLQDKIKPNQNETNKQTKKQPPPTTTTKITTKQNKIEQTSKTQTHQRKKEGATDSITNGIL